jgi:hypothetical protein
VSARGLGSTQEDFLVLAGAVDGLLREATEIRDLAEKVEARLRERASVLSA